MLKRKFVSKMRVLSKLISYLFKHPTRNTAALLDSILSLHQHEYPDSTAGFYFEGNSYETGKGTRFRPLHSNHHEKMREYLAEHNQLTYEKDLVTNYLISVFNACSNLSELYHILPTSLHAILRECSVEKPESMQIPNLDAVYKYNQEGYELMMKRILLNIVEN